MGDPIFAIKMSERQSPDGPKPPWMINVQFRVVSFVVAMAAHARGDGGLPTIESDASKNTHFAFDNEVELFHDRYDKSFR